MQDPDIMQVRSFNRAVTRRLGTLTDRFLGRDRPLAEARVLYEIGGAGADVRDIRERLDLDSGYASRLLRSLERQGLVEVTPGRRDRRVRRVELTTSGKAELAELNRRGDQFAADLLNAVGPNHRAVLLEAMQQLERLLTLAFIRIEEEDPASDDAVFCLREYFAELQTRFPAGFDPLRTIPAEPEDLRPPRGTFVLARLDGRPVGCGALKLTDPGVGSIKRMWVADAVRGVGLGRRILAALEDAARRLGVANLTLETNDTLVEAQQLYRTAGYREVEPFNDEPHADHWFVKHLDTAAAD